MALSSNPFYQKWVNKRFNAKKNGIEMKLTFDEYVGLASEAGITADMIGRSSDQYCLGRTGDTGCYEVGNCQFITVVQNQKDRATNGGAKIGGIKTGAKRTGSRVSEETKDKISKSLTGRKAPAHVVKAMSEASAGDYVIKKPCGTEIQISNLRQFCLANNISYYAMRDRSLGRTKTDYKGGWNCRRVD